MSMMSMLPDTTERCCASCFPQPISQEDVRNAQNLVQTVHYVNCEYTQGPRLGQIVYRSSIDEQDIVHHVYRLDLRNYSDIFRNGFRACPQGNTPDEDYYNLVDHVNDGGAPLNPGRTTPRAFISTTLGSSLSTRYTNPVGTVVYRYEIYAPGGISVALTLGTRCAFPSQREVAFVAGIAPQYIRGVQLFTITGYNSQRYARLERSDPMNPMYVRNMYFNPQSDPKRPLTIQTPEYYYMDIENRRQPLRPVIWRGRSIASQQEKRRVSGIEEWYTNDVANRESYMDAAFRSSRRNEAYLFMKDEYVLINYAPGTTNDRVLSGPLLICDGYPSLADTPFGEYGIDCAFRSHNEDEAFIFCGNLCAVVNYAPGTTNDRITKGPMTIVEMFPFFEGTAFEKGVDAAFEATATSEAYLFRGNQYALINYASPRLIVLRLITEGFASFRNTIFKDGIDAAFASHRKDEAYIYKGRFYALINFAPGTTNDYIIGGVKEILPNWPSLRNILPHKNRGVDVHNHNHVRPGHHDHDKL